MFYQTAVFLAGKLAFFFLFFFSRQLPPQKKNYYVSLSLFNLLLLVVHICYFPHSIYLFFVCSFPGPFLQHFWAFSPLLIKP
jgi:ABC-type phosphate/phosphonate transport system permease subunit